MTKMKVLVGLISGALLLSSCNSSLQNSSETDTIENQLGSNSLTLDNGDLLNRLNEGGNLAWVEDPASDLTGSNSLAVYLTSATDSCAMWVFKDEQAAKSALDNSFIDFPGSEIYTGADLLSGLGIVFVSPYSGAECEFVAANVLGWGK